MVLGLISMLLGNANFMLLRASSDLWTCMSRATSVSGSVTSLAQGHRYACLSIGTLRKIPRGSDMENSRKPETTELPAQGEPLQAHGTDTPDAA